MTPSYSWSETLEIERVGNLVLDALFGTEYIIVPATKYHQRQKIDRFHIHKKDGTVIYRVDYKTDLKAATTKNLALEHISVERAGKIIDDGWIHTSKSHLLVSYIPTFDTAHVLELEDLRVRWPLILASFPPKMTSTPRGPNGGPGYNTWNCCAPISWLKQNGFIKKSMDAVGAQLRFNLKKRID